VDAALKEHAMKHATIQSQVVAVALGLALGTPVWAAATELGGALDPYGTHVASSPTVEDPGTEPDQSDLGSSLDPYGAHVASSTTAEEPGTGTDQSDLGSHLDPYGRK
jgi:hypothetical protein